MVYSLGNVEMVDFDKSDRPSYWNARLWNNFDPAGLTERLTGVGNLSGNFDMCEAMALAGEIIILLSHRIDPHAAPATGLHSIVTSYLAGKGFNEAAEIYDRLYDNSSRENTRENTAASPLQPMGLIEDPSDVFSRERIELFLEELEELTC